MNYWSLFSGGKDSIVTAHVLASRSELNGLVFLDTGIATYDVLPHVKDVSQTYDWPLKVYRTSYSYDDLVLRYGFPCTKRSHQWFMSYLKGRGIRQFKKEFPQGVLASGVRVKESISRSISAKEWGEWEQVKVYAPILTWSDEEVWTYIRANNLPVSPAYQALHISGDCLCGAFGSDEELAMLRAFYPQEYQRIIDLQFKRSEISTKHCKWGVKKKPPSCQCETTIFPHEPEAKHES